MPTFLHNQAGWNINGTIVERTASGVIKAGDPVSPKWEEYRTTQSGTYSFDDINTIRTFLIPKNNGTFRYVDFFMENISVWDDDSNNHWYVAQLKCCVSDSPDFTNFVIAPTRIVFNPNAEDGDFSSHPHLYVFELNVGIYFVYTALGGRVVRINNPLSATPTFTFGTVIQATNSTTDTGFATKLPQANYGYIIGRYVPANTLLLENGVSYNSTTHTHQVVYDIVKINYVSSTAQLCTIQRARQTLEVPLTVWSGSTYYPILFEYVGGHLYLTADEITYEILNNQERIMNHVYVQEYTLSGTTLTPGDVRLNATVFTGNLRYSTIPNPHTIFTNPYLRVYDEFIIDQCQIDAKGNVIPQRLFTVDEDTKGLIYYSLSAPLILRFVTINNETTIDTSIMSSPNRNLLNPTCIYSTFLNKWLCFYYTYQEDEYAYDFSGGFLAANSLADFHNKLMTGEYVPANQFFRPVVMIDTENIILMRSVAERAASSSSHYFPNQVDTLICQSCQAGSSAPIGIALTPGEDYSKILIMKFE